MKVPHKLITCISLLLIFGCYRLFQVYTRKVQGASIKVMKYFVHKKAMSFSSGGIQKCLRYLCWMEVKWHLKCCLGSQINNERVHILRKSNYHLRWGGIIYICWGFWFLLYPSLYSCASSLSPRFSQQHFFFFFFTSVDIVEQKDRESTLDFANEDTGIELYLWV